MARELDICNGRVVDYQSIRPEATAEDNDPEVTDSAES